MAYWNVDIKKRAVKQWLGNKQHTSVNTAIRSLLSRSRVQILIQKPSLQTNLMVLFSFPNKIRNQRFNQAMTYSFHILCSSSLTILTVDAVQVQQVKNPYNKAKQFFNIITLCMLIVTASVV
jgi:hypothetical protein